MKIQPTLCSTAPQGADQNLTLFPSEELSLGVSTHEIGVAVIDRRLRFRSVNAVLAQLNSLPPEAHPGKPLDAILGSLAGQVAVSLEKVFSSGMILPNIPLRGRIPTRSTPIEIQQFFFPLLGNRGKVIEVGAFVFERKSKLKSTTDSDAILDGKGERVQDAGIVSLSGREHEVLKLLAIGKSVKEASHILGISPKTIETYKNRLMHKINASSIPLLIHYAIRHHVVQLSA